MYKVNTKEKGKLVSILRKDLHTFPIPVPVGLPVPQTENGCGVVLPLSEPNYQIGSPTCDGNAKSVNMVNAKKSLNFSSDARNPLTPPQGKENSPELLKMPDDQVPSSKKKRFPIGAWQRHQKVISTGTAIAARTELGHLEAEILKKREEITELNRDLEWRERLLGEHTPVGKKSTSTQVAMEPANQLFQQKKETKMQPDVVKSKVKVPTLVHPNKTDDVQLHPATSKKRRNSTVMAAQAIHGSSMQNVRDGLWHSLVKVCTPTTLERYITKSEKCKKIVCPGKVTKRKDMKDRLTHGNIVRSVKMLYKGGMISSRKYIAVRLADKGVAKPEPLTYSELKAEIDKIQESLSSSLVDENTPNNGCYRNIEATLLKLADLYLRIDEVLVKEYGTGLKWFPNKGDFLFAIGADGAPSGKFRTKTSLLLSFLNVEGRVGSCDHNFLLFGGDVTEDDPVFLNHLKMVISEVEAIEQKEYAVGSVTVTFRLELVPSDCKWAAVACGELSNAATYPSTFGNVHKDDLGKLNASLGTDENSTWKPWSYIQRLAHAKKVIDLKTTVKDRAKILQNIAGRHSRQEHLPIIGKYSEKVYVEPLHLKNNACQQLNKVFLMEVLNRTDEKVLKKQFQDKEFVASPIGLYLSCLKERMKAGKLYIRLIRWLRENKTNMSSGGITNCPIRFTGEDSMKFCLGFPFLTKILD